MDSASGHGKAVRCTAGIEKVNVKRYKGLGTTEKKETRGDTTDYNTLPT